MWWICSVIILHVVKKESITLWWIWRKNCWIFNKKEEIPSLWCERTLNLMKHVELWTRTVKSGLILKIISMRFLFVESHQLLNDMFWTQMVQWKRCQGLWRGRDCLQNRGYFSTTYIINTGRCNAFWAKFMAVAQGEEPA